MKKCSLILGVILISATGTFAQRITQQPLLIDMPTAATLDRGSYDLRLRMFANGGLIGGVAVGISNRFMFGLSFGGENIIGEGKVNWNPEPAIQARFRLIDEDYSLPAVTLGFDSQGFGAHVDSLDRFVNKSRGLFAVATKNYAVLHNFGIHGGINYSLENKDDDKGINIFMGADLSFNREFRVLVEYDLARNDNEHDTQFGSGDGYLNAGLQWAFSDRLFLQFHLKNLLENGARNITREFKISYFEYF